MIETFLKEWWGLLLSIGSVLGTFFGLTWARARHETKQEDKIQTLEKRVKTLEAAIKDHEKNDAEFRVEIRRDMKESFEKLDRRMENAEKENQDTAVRLGKIEVQLSTLTNLTNDIHKIVYKLRK